MTEEALRGRAGGGEADAHPAVTLRPVEAADEPFLRRVYASTRAEELAAVPWDAAQKEAFLSMQFAAQQQHYRARFPRATHDLVLADGRPVGRLYVSANDDEIRILDVALLPESRGRRIGTPLIEGLTARAARERKPVRVYVEAHNPSLRLFERLGFRKVEEDGINFLMEWRAD